VIFDGAGTTDSTYIGQDGDDDVTFVNVSGTAVASFGDGDNTVSAAALTIGVLVVESGDGDDTATVATSLSTGSVSLDLGNGDNTVNLSLVALAGGEVTIVLGTGDDTVSIATATTANTGTVAMTLGAGTNTLSLANLVDLSGLTISISGLDVIELTSTAAAVTVGSDLLDGESIIIETSGATGTNTSVLSVLIADGVKTFDGSELTISDSVSSYIDGLDITATTLTDDFTIIGSEGDDIITTGAGDDTITGGKGNDVMDAGTGENVYIIGNSDSGKLVTTADYITAFVTGDDTLSLGVAGTSSNYSELVGVNNDTLALTLVDVNALMAAGDTYVFVYGLDVLFPTGGADAADGALFEDTDGDGDADLFVILTGLAAAADFDYSDIVA